MYSNHEKTEMILIHRECNKKFFCRCAFMQTINIFPKIFGFFTILFNRMNDVYVKIHKTAQLAVFYVKRKSALTLQMYFNFANVLRVAFSVPSGSLSLMKYPLHTG
jgi:hypothetical protein